MKHSDDVKYIKMQNTCSVFGGMDHLRASKASITSDAEHASFVVSFNSSNAK